MWVVSQNISLLQVKEANTLVLVTIQIGIILRNWLPVEQQKMNQRHLYLAVKVVLMIRRSQWRTNCDVNQDTHGCNAI